MSSPSPQITPLANDLGEIRPATPDDILYIGWHMRPEDAREIYSQALVSPLEWAKMIEAKTDDVWVGVVGQPIAAFGCIRPFALTNKAMPWMIATNGVEKHSLAFLRHSRHVVECWRHKFDLLENFVDERNTTSIAWLKWLGFTIDPAKPHGPLHRPFHRFHMTGA